MISFIGNKNKFYFKKMNNNLNYNLGKNNEIIFECKANNFVEFQRDLMGFITNYIDKNNKKKFFEINVKR